MLKRSAAVLVPLCVWSMSAYAQPDFDTWQVLFSSAKPKLDWSKRPQFEAEDIAAKRDGDLALRVCTDETGRPTNIKVGRSSASELRTQATTDWILATQFDPAIDIKGQPVASCQTDLQFVWMLPPDDPERTAYPMQPMLAPEYPAPARRNGETGTTTATFCINASGAVTSVTDTTLSGSRLADAFGRWLRKTPFTPISKDGKAVEACGLTFSMTWTLAGR